MTLDGHLRVGRDALAVIGVVTAVVAFVQLLRSGWSSLPAVLPWAGAFYVLVGIYVGTRALLNRSGYVSRLTRGFVVLGFAGSLGMIVLGALSGADGMRAVLAFFGFMGLVCSIFSAPFLYLDFREARERSVKTCPDCAEQVKANARKCRFCGYRFDQ